jgi:hypothetical protein
MRAVSVWDETQTEIEGLLAEADPDRLRAELRALS